MILTVTAIGGWMLVVGGLLWSNHRWHRAQTPTPDPRTVELPPFGSDPDDDTVRVTGLPPVPPSQRWTEADTAMLAWYAAGRAER